MSREEEKRVLREAMRNSVLAPQGKVEDYNIALFRKDFSLDYPERVQISISRRLDNLLRNFAYSSNEMPTHRLEAFLKKYGMYGTLESYAQRQAATDIHSIRWHFMQGNLTEEEAINLVRSIYPRKVA